MMLVKGKKSTNWACYACQVAIGVEDPELYAENLRKAGTMMKKGDKVIIGQLEWKVCMGKGDRDFLLRRPNTINNKAMDFCMVEVIDFVFDKEIRKWVEIETLPEDGEEIFKK